MRKRNELKRCCCRRAIGVSEKKNLNLPSTKKTTQLLYPDTAASVLSRNTSQRVAIVGAGAAGLTAAATLQQLGYKQVVVFESNPKVGGKCFTVEVAGKFYDLGAIQISSVYQLVPSLAAATKTPFRRFTEIPKSEARSLNSSSSSSTNTTTPTFAENVELFSGFAALAATSKRYFKQITAPGMLQASTSASMAGVSFSEFAAQNKFGTPLTQR